MPGVGATYENVVNAEHVYEDLNDSDLSAGWTEVGAAVPNKTRSVPPQRVKRVQVRSFRVFQPVVGSATVKDRKRYEPFALKEIPLDDDEWKKKVEATLRKESVKPWQVAGMHRGEFTLERFLFQKAAEETPQNAELPLDVQPDQLSGFGEAVFEWLSVLTFIKGTEDPDPDMHWPLPVYEPKADVWASTAEVESMFRTFSSDPAAMEKARKGNAEAVNAKFMMPPWSPATGAVMGPNDDFMYEACTDLVIKPNHDVNYKIFGGPPLAAIDYQFHPDFMGPEYRGDVRKKRVKRGLVPVEIMLTAKCDGARDVWGLLGPRLVIRGTRFQIVEFTKLFCDKELGFSGWWSRLPFQTRQAFLSRPKWYGLPPELDPYFRDVIRTAEETARPGEEFVLGRLNEEKLVGCMPTTNWFTLEDMISKKYGPTTVVTVGGEPGTTGRTTLFFHAAIDKMKFGTPFVSTIISARKLNAAMDFGQWKDRALFLKKLEKERLVLNSEERKLVHQAHLNHISDYHQKLFVDERSTHIYTPRSVRGTVTGPGHQPRESIPPSHRYTALDPSGLRHSIGADGRPGPSTLSAPRAKPPPSKPPPSEIRTATCWPAAVRRESKAQKIARVLDILEDEDTENNDRRVSEGLPSRDPWARPPSQIPRDAATDAIARQGALAQEDHPLRPMGARRAQEVLAENRVEGIPTIQESDEPLESQPQPLPTPEAEAPAADPPPDPVPEQHAGADVCRLLV